MSKSSSPKQTQAQTSTTTPDAGVPARATQIMGDANDGTGVMG
jgi:hypothetical protein